MNRNLDNVVLSELEHKINDENIFYDDLRTGYIKKLVTTDEIPEFILEDFNWGYGPCQYGFFSIHGTVAFVGDDKNNLISMLQVNGFQVLNVS
jgi:hypothetical protein